MNIYERDHVTAVINYFWGPNLTTPQAVNKSAALIAYEALEKANLCSSAMDLVPRPMGVPSTSYAIKELAKIGKRIMSGDTSIYHVCKGAIGLSYKSSIQIALMGA